MIKKGKIAILGAGKTGLASYNHYKNLDYSVTIWDDDYQLVEKLKNSYNFSHYTDWSYDNLDFIIVSPGIPLYKENHFIIDKSIKYNISIYSDIELFIMNNPHINYIAVSGTNGKSTVVSLLSSIFNKAGKRCICAGNIGFAVFDINANNYDYIILELSSYHLSLMNYIHFKCAILLNITEDHLDYHGSYDNYKKAKFRIFENQKAQDLAIIDITLEKEKCFHLQSQVLIINSLQNKSVYIENNNIIDNYFHNNKQILANTDLIYLQGEHNYKNIAFAYSAAKFFDLDDQYIIDGIIHFKGLEHRQSYLGTLNNINFINDSKATNQASTLQSLERYKDIYLILGGVLKINNLDTILSKLKEVKFVFLIGSSTNVFANILQFHNIKYKKCINLEEATNLSYQEALKENKGTVLLSPSCASFDDFKSFEHRGNIFKTVFQQLIKELNNN